MIEFNIDFTKKLGKIKPVNASNNGPKIPGEDQTSGNFETFKQLHIPYARVHDANLCYAYGAPHTVDVYAIFKDFNADPDDPANYDFTMTDIYLKAIAAAGTEPFYRLGGAIEHYPRKWFTRAPADFQKFAVICEHIIRHCTGGWANGLNMKITYWEIWNEADLDRDDAENKRNWQGTAEQFFEMFCITAKHLKEKFPHLKIGGPASAAPVNDWNGGKWTEKLFAAMEKNGVKLDFYSWHRYCPVTKDLVADIRKVRDFLDTHGQPQAESICNEWNYVNGWSDNWVYSLKTENNMKGAAFAMAAMLSAQKAPVDMMMYYDMRVNSQMNGLWAKIDFTRQKPWYCFYMFDKLAQLGTEAAANATSEDAALAVEASCVAAVDGNGVKAACLALYTDDDNFAIRKIRVNLKGLTAADKKRTLVRLLDEDTDCFDIPFAYEGDSLVFARNFPTRCALLLQF